MEIDFTRCIEKDAQAFQYVDGNAFMITRKLILKKN